MSVDFGENITDEIETEEHENGENGDDGRHDTCYNLSFFHIL